MSFFKEIPTLTEEEWENLHITNPLVKKGEDRQKKLEEIVTKWCTPLSAEDGSKPGPWSSCDDYLAAGAFMLDRVALWDANTNEPIDFGDLLWLMEQRARSEGAPSEYRYCQDRVIALRCCRIDQCFAPRCVVRPRLICEGCNFRGSANFIQGTFGHETSFVRTAFRCGAWFEGAGFGNRTSFEHSTFAKGAWFQRATFGSEARFNSGRFGYSSSFESATFGELAQFAAATFGGWVSFHSATFGGWASFRSTLLGERAHFSLTRFGQRGGVGGALVRTTEPWERAWIDSDSGTGVRRRGQAGAWMRRCRARASEWIAHRKESIDWSWVAKLGRMPVLARVSYLALFVVPMIAGVWPSVRGMTRWAEGVVHDAATTIREERLKLESFTPPTENEKVLAVIDELRGAVGRVETHADDLKKATSQVADRVDHLPYGWALAFGAALFAALGHLLYYLCADERVREATVQAFRAQRNNEFASAGEHLRRDRLQRAFPHLNDIAGLLPYSRHPNLVSRNNEAVWLPSSLEMLEKIPERRTEQVEGEPERAGAGGTGPAKEPVESKKSDASDRKPDGAATKPVRPADAPAIPHTRGELEQIIIDEGARAEYDLAARQRMGWAYVSGFCYFVAAVLVAWLVCIQLNVVMRAAGFDWWW